MSTFSERRAAALARRQPPAPPPPSTDAAELVQSFRVVQPPDPPPEVAIAARPLPPFEPDPDRPRAGFWDIALRGSHVAVVDTETTDRDPTKAHIVEVSVVVIQGLGTALPEVAYTTRVRPPVQIPADATRIHGITDADVADAPTWDEVVLDLARVLAGRAACAYNAPYEAQVIAAECDRVGARVPYAAIWGRWLDPLILAKGLDRYEKGRKLAQVASRRGILVDAAAHGAAADAMATAMLLERMLGEAADGKNLGRGQVYRMPRGLSIAGYLQWQRDQALAEEVDFAEYQRKSGRRDPVDMPWHTLSGVPIPALAEPAAPRTSNCKACNAPIVWLVTKAGKSIPLDPAVLRAMPQAEVTAQREADPSFHPSGRHVAVTTDDGETRWGYLDPSGSLVGRESHWATCPRASRFRGSS